MQNPIIPSVWALSVPVLLTYVVAAFLLLLVLSANQRAVEEPKDGRPMPPAGAAAVTFASNFLAVATIGGLARMAGVPAHKSLILFPLGFAAEDYGRRIWRDRAAWQTPAAGLAGSSAGMVLAALVALHATGTQEYVSRPILPAEVKTVPIAEVINTGASWAISLQLLACYILAVALFFSVHHLLVRRERRLAAEQRRDAPLAAHGVAGFIANFGVALAVLLFAGWIGVTPRLAMLLVPLFLIVESYAKFLVEEETVRGPHWAGLISSSAGMLVGLVTLMRGAPFH